MVLPRTSNGVSRPDYSERTMKRVRAARERAQDTKRIPWYLGTSPHTGARQYEVYSFTDNTPYYPAVHDEQHFGGFVYALPEDDDAPIVYIDCTCAAFLDGTNPCKHAARVQLKLEADHKRDPRNEPPYVRQSDPLEGILGPVPERRK